MSYIWNNPEYVNGVWFEANFFSLCYDCRNANLYNVRGAVGEILDLFHNKAVALARWLSRNRDYFSIMNLTLEVTYAYIFKFVATLTFSIKNTYDWHLIRLLESSELELKVQNAYFYLNIHGYLIENILVVNPNQ